MTSARKLLSTILLVCSTVVAYAQNTAKPCDAPEGKQMDFWLGDWVITYPDNTHAYTVVEKKMDGCVIHEQFRDPGRNYIGESWSVYNPHIQKWQQTRVDNQGAYLQMAGRYEDSAMILYAKPKEQKDGSTLMMRIVYSNIKPDNFDWRWESSSDNGNTWTINIQMHYDRKK